MHVEWWYSYTPSREPAGGGTSAAALCMQQRWPGSWRWHCLKLLCQDLLQDVLRSPDIQDILKDSTTETSNKCEKCEGDKWKTVIRDYYSRDFFEWQLYPLRFLWSSIFFLSALGLMLILFGIISHVNFRFRQSTVLFPRTSVVFSLLGISANMIYTSCGLSSCPQNLLGWDWFVIHI